MKIVHFIDHLRRDGSQVALQHLAHGLAQRGHQQSIVCINNSWDQELATAFGDDGVDLRVIKKASLLSGVFSISTLRWMDHNEFDVAITWLYFSDVIGRTLAYLAGVPKIISTIRARNMHYKSWQRWLARQTMRWVHVIILNSAYVREFAITQEGAPPDRILVIPNGIRLEDGNSSVDKGALRSELGLASDEYVIGSIGRFTYQKGFDVLLEALSLMQGKEVHLILVGRGEEENKLHQLASDLKLEKRAHFLGYRRDISRLLAGLDLYVQPSRFEGMPNALLEAMAAGCPVVASAVDGICDLIQDGIHGWLVPPENPRVLSNAIDGILKNLSESQRRGTAGKERIRKEFDLEAMIDAWEQVLIAKS